MLGIVIQARTGSNRLPNKMLLPFHSSKGVLELLLDKLCNMFNDIQIIVATTTNNRDDRIVELCLKNKINYFRGSENNVLQRFIDAADKFNLTRIIRVCADNPFLSMEALSVLITKFQNSDFDYLSFQTSDGVPVIKTQYGFWTEAVTLLALKKIEKHTNSLNYLEHVTNYIYEHPESFNIKLLFIDSFVEQQRSIRMTLDTHEDYLLLREIYNEYVTLKERTLRSLLDLVSKNRIWIDKMNLQILKNRK
jgi:spore coat polysaccharide biosynthesis protein SpsF